MDINTANIIKKIKAIFEKQNSLERLAKEATSEAECQAYINDAIVCASKVAELLAKHKLTKEYIENFEGTEFDVKGMLYKVAVHEDWHIQLVAVITNAFDCKFIQAKGDSSFIFFGYEEDTEVVKLTLDYLLPLLGRVSYAAYMCEYKKPHRNNNTDSKLANYQVSFIIGALNALDKRFKAMKVVVVQDSEIGYQMAIVVTNMKLTIVDNSFKDFLKLNNANEQEANYKPNVTNEKAFIEGYTFGDKVDIVHNNRKKVTS